MRRPRRFVVLVLALVITGLGAWWTHRSFEAQLGSGRAQALARLLATSHAPRMVEAPGVEAWLAGLLQDAGARLSPSERASYEALLRPSRAPHLPPPMGPVSEYLHLRAPSPPLRPATLTEVSEEIRGASDQGQSLRLVEHLRLEDETLVLTRRRSLFTAGTTVEPALHRAAEHLVAIAEAWTQGERAPRGTPLPRLVRLYATMEDGSVLSLPFTHSGDRDDPERRAAALAEETRQSRRRPRAPSLVSGGAFLDLDFGEPLDEQAHYSGVYTDVAGSGFVATVSVPVQYSDTNAKLVVAADVVVEIELRRVVEAADGDLRLAVTDPVREQRSAWWQPWSTLATSLPPDAPEDLRREVQVQALREAREDVWAPQHAVVHHRLQDGRGALFALQVSRRRWLVGWSIEASAPVPWGPMLVIPGLLLGLLAWVERRRTRTEDERDDARAELRQRHGALDLLHIPLVVVDPNDDTVVRANAAARELGLSSGRPFGDGVASDPDSRSHYHHEQRAGGGRRRAYGVRLQSDGDQPSRFALVRSVSLSESLPGLGAEAHHRLGLVCVVENEDELGPVLGEHRDAARQDERNRLAAVVDHGLDTLARVLAARLERAHTEDELAFCRWLAEYLLRRLHVSQWVLDRWGDSPKLEAERILGPEHLRRALDRYERIFALVRDDPRLRDRLHWNNGVLAATPRSDAPVVEAWLDWPPEYRLAVPTDGVFGFVLGELLVNAIEHGMPGSTVELEAEIDRGRRELSLRMRNPAREADDGPRTKAYGGRAIVQELARLSGWSMTQGREGEDFRVQLSCPVTQQRGADEVD